MEQVERVEDDDLLTNLADLAEHGAEEGGDDAAAIAETAQGGGNDLKLPFAFKHCSEISSSSTSSWRATCEICGKKVRVCAGCLLGSCTLHTRNATYPFAFYIPSMHAFPLNIAGQHNAS